MRDGQQADSRRSWVEPTLTKHESLFALTKQRLHPITRQPLDPNDPHDRVLLAQIPGSQGFFP